MEVGVRGWRLDERHDVVDSRVWFVGKDIPCHLTLIPGCFLLM